ncbi:hypothetical protein V2J09_000021 [Rumex salicifolius]
MGVILIYGIPNVSTRLNLWQELEDFAMANNKPWLSIDDYNATKCVKECSSHSRTTQCALLIFCERIDKLNLIDLGYSGPRYTWWRGTDLSSITATYLDRDFAMMVGAYSSLRPQCIISLPHTLITCHFRSLNLARLRQPILRGRFVSKANFLVDGDRNTRFYYLSTLIRQKSNNINRLEDVVGTYLLVLMP